MPSNHPADVCILYARQSASRLPSEIAKLLRPISVWWDKKIVSGDFPRAIYDAIEKAACVVPIWSEGARESPILRDELKFAEQKGVSIVPFAVAPHCEPLGFGGLQTVVANGWDGRSHGPEIQLLKSRVLEVVRAKRGSWESSKFRENTSSLRPVYFFSVSSHETKIKPLDALNALKVFGAKHVLISAYDFKGRGLRKLRDCVEACQSNGAIVVLDSGNYERYRRDDTDWTHAKFKEAIQKTPHDLAFSYDRIEPPTKIARISDEVVRAFERDCRLTSKPLIPIIHLPKGPGGGLGVLAAKIAKRVATSTRAVSIAIPERELGDGLFARIQTMRAIRHALDELPFYQAVHILGTGTPVSVALLTAAGADSFDGLEWCRYVADAHKATLHHFHLYEFFRWQDEIPGVSEVTRAAAKARKVRYAGKVVMHNLDFYSSWGGKLRLAASSSAGMSSLLGGYLDNSALQLARSSLPEVFGDAV